MGRKRKRRFTRPTRGEIQEFREFLGPVAANYDYAELIRLRWEMHEMAKVLLDIYEYRKHPALPF